MTDSIDGRTERERLLDMAADHLAAMYYELHYPQTYRSTRRPNGHTVIVMVVDAATQGYPIEDTQPFGTIKRVDEDDAIED